MGLSVSARLTDRNSSVRLFEVANRGDPHLRPAASADFLQSEETSTRGSPHFHSVVFDIAALPKKVQGRDILSDHQGSHIITRPLAPENYPETSSANVICVNQRPRSPETNILDLGVCKLLVSTHCTRRQARAAAKRRLQFDCSNKVNRRRDGQSMPRVQQARSQNVCIRREGSRSMMRPFSNRFCVSRRSGKTTHSNGDTHAGKYKKALGYSRRV